MFFGAGLACMVPRGHGMSSTERLPTTWVGNSQNIPKRSAVPARHSVKLGVTEIMNIGGMTAYHSSVIVDDAEYYFDSLGIMPAPILFSHSSGQQRQSMKTDVIDIGRTHKSGRALLRYLNPFFQKGTYDILLKNCNSFSDVALFYLTGARLEARYSRMERMMCATTPVSTSVLNRLFRSYMEHSTGKACEVDVYVANPRAQEFSPDDIISYIGENDDAGVPAAASTWEEPGCIFSPLGCWTDNSVPAGGAQVDRWPGSGSVLARHGG